MTIYVTFKVFRALLAAGLLQPISIGIFGTARPDEMWQCQLIAGERALEFPA